MVTPAPEDPDFLLGNDVVDLRDPDSMGACGREKFLRRAFTAGERFQIRNDDHPDTRLWSCWAGKESAYKALVSRFPRTLFAWGDYETDFSSRTVWAGSHALALDLQIREDEMVHVCSVGRMDSGVVIPAPEILNEISIEIFNNDESTFPSHLLGAEVRPQRGSGATDDSILVRLLAGRLIARELQLNPQRVAVGGVSCNSDFGGNSENGETRSPPRVSIDGRLTPIAISLSHHGRYLAAACHLSRTVRNEYLSS